jgi:hypothetical protein
MSTGFHGYDRIEREKDEWQEPLSPQTEVVTALLMLTGLIAAVSLVGWLIAR